MSHSLKKKLIAKILENFEEKLLLLKNAALTAREAAIHEESKAEDKYDTRGLEASYLAGAQAQRAAELEELIYFYQNLPVKEFTPEDSIEVTALVELQSTTLSKPSYYFLVPKGGAQKVNLDGKDIQVITVSSPLGAELLGRSCGEDFVLQSPKASMSYTVLSVA